MILRCRACKVSSANNVSVVIDPVRVSVVSTERAEVFQASLSPQKGMSIYIPFEGGKAGYIAVLVESIRFAVSASQSTQVEHGPVSPKKWVYHRKFCCRVKRWVRDSGNISSVVDHPGQCVRAAQRSKAPHDSVLPEERACLEGIPYQRKRIRNSVECEPNDLAATVHRRSQAVVTAFRQCS